MRSQAGYGADQVWNCRLGQETKQVTRTEEGGPEVFSLQEQEGREAGGTALLGSARGAAAGENVAAVGCGGHTVGGGSSMGGTRMRGAQGQWAGSRKECRT